MTSDAARKIRVSLLAFAALVVGCRYRSCRAWPLNFLSLVFFTSFVKLDVPMQTRELSSSSTVWYKFIFPAIWISAFSAANAAIWLGAFHGRDNEPPPDWMRWQFLAFWIVGSAFLIWFSRRLHRVSLRDNALVASDFFREVSIPLTAITRVSQSYMSNPTTITVYLDCQTSLGRRITFVPAGRSHYLSEHPITTELKAILARTHKTHHANA
jgi:hypothetical protein